MSALSVTGADLTMKGDVRVMPTPEQWDLVALLKGRQPDKAIIACAPASPFPISRWTTRWM